MSISAIIPHNYSAGHSSLWGFFLAFSAECCQQYPGTGEASAGGDSGKTIPAPAPTGASPTVSITNCRESNCKLILSSQQPWDTETGNRHEMKHKESCLSTRSFNLFLDCQGNQTLEKTVDSPSSEMLKPHPNRALSSVLEVTCFSRGLDSTGAFQPHPSCDSVTNNSSQITRLLMCDLYSLLEIKESSCKHLKPGLDIRVPPLIKHCRENFGFPVYSCST